MIISKRISYFDFLRGMAIMMVVAIHTYPSFLNWNDSNIASVLQILIRNTMNCAVPMFLAISGYFIARKKLDTLEECWAFWKKQIPVVYIPCLVMSLPWLLLHCISTQNGGGCLKALIYYFLCGYSVYYFIALIIECYLLAPFLVRHNNKTMLLSIACLSIVATCMLEYLRFFVEYELPLIIRGSFIILFIFFFIGIYLARHSRDYSLWIPIAMIVMGYILGIAEMHGVYELQKTTQVGQKVSLYLYDAGIILLSMSSKIERLYRENRFTRTVLYIGEISFGVYFTHVYFIFVANYFFPSIRGSWFLFWAFCLITTVAFITIVKRLSPSLSRRYLGYR